MGCDALPFLKPLSAEYCITAISLSLLRGKLLFPRREILQIRGRGRFHIFRHLFSMRASEFLQFPYSRLECFFRPETYANTLLFPCMVETFHDWGEPKYAEVETVLLRDFQEASCFFYIFFSRKKVQKRDERYKPPLGFLSPGSKYQNAANPKFAIYIAEQLFPSTGR